MIRERHPGPAMSVDRRHRLSTAVDPLQPRRWMDGMSCLEQQRWSAERRLWASVEKSLGGTREPPRSESAIIKATDFSTLVVMISDRDSLMAPTLDFFNIR